MRLAWLGARMLRYRIAALLLPFFVLAPAVHGRLAAFRWQYVAGLVALSASYVVATSLNDVFDEAIDRINRPGRRDRPLVTGEATKRQLLELALVAATVALAAGSAIGAAGAALVALSLALNVAYSVPPLRLSARGLTAPVVLALAYTVLPYAIGLAAGGLRPTDIDARLMGAFATLFAGRMLLKDFRDRRGDAAYGKRTFLLMHGKGATLAVTLASVLVGTALLLSALPPTPFLPVVVSGFFVGVLVQLARLRLASNPRDEQLAIALGARMGSAAVLTVLGSFLLIDSGASPADQAAFVIVMAAAFSIAFVYASARRPLSGGVYT